MSNVFIYLASFVLSDFAFCHLFPVSQWSCSDFQQAPSVQLPHVPSPWAQLSSVLTHLFLQGESDITKSCAGAWSKPTKIFVSLKKTFVSSKKKKKSSKLSYLRSVSVCYTNIFSQLKMKAELQVVSQAQQASFRCLSFAKFKENQRNDLLLSFLALSALTFLKISPQTAEQQRSRVPKDGCSSLKCSPCLLLSTRRRSWQARLLPHYLLWSLSSHHWEKGILNSSSDHCV